MVILLQEKNFSPNVIYFVAGHWRAPERVQVHPNVSRYTPSWKGPSLSYPINYYERNVAICSDLRWFACVLYRFSKVDRVWFAVICRVQISCKSVQISGSKSIECGSLQIMWFAMICSWFAADLRWVAGRFGSRGIGWFSCMSPLIKFTATTCSQ